jgi:murein DD-endopeptidase MepM/ murein hydrolase activator NlpD
VVTSAFGAPRGGGAHEGIDLAAPKGTIVRATAAGKVVFAGRSGRFGRLVVVDHGGGWETRYAHLRSLEVRSGATVDRGRKVGTVGRSGNATGFHLHYEVRRDGRPQDPWPLMGAP